MSELAKDRDGHLSKESDTRESVLCPEALIIPLIVGGLCFIVGIIILTFVADFSSPSNMWLMHFINAVYSISMTVALRSFFLSFIYGIAV